jgi:hypothetical protein
MTVPSHENSSEVATVGVGERAPLVIFSMSKIVFRESQNIDESIPWT